MSKRDSFIYNITKNLSSAFKCIINIALGFVRGEKVYSVNTGVLY